MLIVEISASALASIGFTCGISAEKRSMCLRQHCKLTPEANGYLEHAMEEMNFSARAHDRILKVARTLADLSGATDIWPNDILEAIQYRPLDRKLSS